jgi:photosystem II stability/assembly factor-like uncharacterized protein
VTQLVRSFCLGAAGTLALCIVLPAHAQHFPAGIYQEFQWRMIGPPRGGRTHAVAGVPGEPNTFYVGAVNGGVWKTDDAGRTWRAVFDDQPTQSIGAIAVAPSDPRVLYVGTGEGLYRPDLSIGNGVYRSADGGATWEHRGLPDAQQIAAVAVDPHDANRVFAAVLGHPFGPSAERGIFRTRDGGHTWERVLFQDENTGGASVAIDPRHPDTVYASLWEGRLGPWEDRNEFNGTGGGLFKSTDGGTTWQRLTTGLPTNLAQANIEVAPSLPSRVFAMVATTDPGDYASSAGLGLYRSDDGGEHWARITDDPRPALRIGGGDLASVRVDPSNPDVVYSASIVTMKSVDGGRTWTSLRGAPGGDDYQDLWISPTDGRVIALVSDQGALVTVNGGRTWSSWFNQPTAALWHIGVTPTFPYQVCSGQQDSGSVCVASRGNDGSITSREWHPIAAIEYASVAPDPLDPDIVYGAGRNEVTKYHWSTGQTQNVTPVPVRGPDVRADRTEPLLFSPVDPHTLYYAANRLYRTSDGGATWQAISPDLSRDAPGIPASVGARHVAGAERQRGAIYAIGASPLALDTLWAGTDDGLVWVTRDGGAHWTDVTPAGLGDWSKVTQLEASHFDVQTAYVSVSRFRVDDLRPYLYRTRDGGRTWQSIGAGLPADAPVNAVREDTVRRGLLFAATETAVWVSYDDGDHWDSLQQNLPHTSMRDLAVHGSDLIVATHGRSFWILDDISRLRQATPGTLAEPLLVKPAVAYRIPRATWPDTPIPPDEPLAANPPSGAVIEYFLPRDAKAVSLDVLDAAGHVVRRFASGDRPEADPDQIAKQLIPHYWDMPFRSLAVTAGMHRWVWDLHYPAPESASRGYENGAVAHATPRTPGGPVALPGTYTARLSVDGRTQAATFRVEEDPRTHVATTALEQQFQLATTLADLMTQSTRAVNSARSLREQLKALTGHASVSEAARAFDGRLAALLESPKGEPAEGAAKPLLPALQGRVAALYEGVERADAAPTAAQVRESEAAAELLRARLEEWRGVASDLGALNARLHAARLPALRPDLAPPRDLSEADED